MFGALVSGRLLMDLVPCDGVWPPVLHEERPAIVVLGAASSMGRFDGGGDWWACQRRCGLKCG